MKKVTLQTPIIRKGADPVAEVMIREPVAGDLRGLKQIDLVQMDVNAMMKLLPRITQPPLLPDELEPMNAADFFGLSGAVAGFFATKADREQIGIEG